MPSPRRPAVSYAFRRRETSFLVVGRFRDIRTQEEAELEACRQNLCDQRWQRIKSQVTTAAVATAVFTGAIPFRMVAERLLTAVGL